MKAEDNTLAAKCANSLGRCLLLISQARQVNNAPISTASLLHFRRSKLSCRFEASRSNWRSEMHLCSFSLEKSTICAESVLENLRGQSGCQSHCQLQKKHTLLLKPSARRPISASIGQPSQAVLPGKLN